MDYEKRYKELAGKMKKAYLYAQTDSTKAVLEDIMPELKESEDEKIRKALIRFFQRFPYDRLNYENLKSEEAITWLEKQGEQETDEWKEGDIIRHGGVLALVIKGRRAMKSNGEIFTVQYPDEWVKASPNEIEHFLNEFEKRGEQKPFDYENATIVQKDFAPKAEPKFHEGDWIVDNQGLVHQIERVVENITTSTFGYDIVGGGYFNDKSEGVRLWNIKDAKDGDILAGKIDGDNYILIFKQVKDGWVETYGHYYDSVDRFCVSSQLFCRDYQGTFTPATKEQCDLLLTKMGEAGYELDEGSKELKLLITNGGDFESENCRQNPACSEDETSIAIKDSKAYRIGFADGEAHAKEEMQSSWSEEDKKKLNRIYYLIAEAANEHAFSTTCRLIGDKECVELQDFLKSIKQRIGG